MYTINKQNFLAELGKLLTFMYDEDRRLALSMYERMFDEVQDDQLLIQQLLSPTRQAVVIARAYDSKARKLQVHAEARDADMGDNPKFIEAIERIELEVLSSLSISAQAEPEVVEEIPVSEDQISFFDLETEASSDVPAEPEEIEEPDIAVADEAVAEPVEFQTEQAETEVPEEESAIAAEDESDEASPEAEPEAEIIEADPAEPATEAEPEEAAADEDPASADSNEDAAVDSFMADFAIVPEAEVVEKNEPQPVEVETAVSEQKEYVAEAAAPVAKRKVRVFLLLLMLIVFIPLTLVLVLLLLIPTLASLAIAAGAISTGVVTVTAAFSGFAVFADIMVVLGAALILLALGLLFLWLFVWFIGGAIIGLIRAVIRLIGRCCIKEVYA